MKTCVSTLLVVAALALSACGGKSTSTSTPPATTYTIGGSVSGLSGTGLVLQNSAADNLSITANGSFTFKTPIASGGAYKVTVLTQPSNPTQTCTVSSGTGTATAKVTSVQVACTTATYTIGGTISGLTSTGLVLQDNGGDNLSVIASETSFTFATSIDAGLKYDVTVLTQPTNPSQACAITNGSATASANVTNVQVACVSAYTIGGTVSGLTGTGLVLQDNGGDNLSIAANQTSFTFLTSVGSGTKYNVTVLTQPTGQNCLVTAGDATVTANVTNVQVTCSNVATYAIGGTISNLTGSGLVLQDNGGDNLPISANQTSFTFATQIASGSKYKVTVLTQPTGPSETCSVTSGSGTATAAVTNVVISCNSAPNEWTWVSGSDANGQAGTYGTMGTADPANVPGARGAAVSWTDASGNLWLFGGFGLDSNGTTYDLNDLWEYSAGQWTWIGGSNFADQRGT